MVELNNRIQLANTIRTFKNPILQTEVDL